MNHPLKLFCLIALGIALPALALDARAHNDQSAVVAKFLNGLKSDNSVYMVTHNIDFYAGLAKGQKPTATIVTCSDSRVQSNMFDRSPEGDLFTIRNIGNQLATSEGSVEYGVHHLHSPILVFLGHSRCGAIAAVGGNYSKESTAIKKELDTISIPKEIGNMEGVTANVNNQVALAMKKFEEEVGAGHLTIMGAVMDFADDLHQGAGKLHVININGETDPAKIDNLAALLNKAKMKPVAEKVGHKVEVKSVVAEPENQPPEHNKVAEHAAEASNPH